jgi:heat shock protein HslJ
MQPMQPVLSWTEAALQAGAKVFVLIFGHVCPDERTKKKGDFSKMKIRSSILMLAIMTACSAAAFGQGIYGKQWWLTELNGRNIGSTKAYFEIAARDSRMTGNTGCNRMFGSATVKGKRLTFTRIGMTRMFCSGEPGRIEGEFTKALESVKRYVLAANRLDLYSGNKRLARLTAGPTAPDEPSGTSLGDRKWMLETMNGREISGSRKKAFVVFDPAKSIVGGESSCNVYGGTLKVNGNKISITEVISTMRACVEDERMGIERSFLDLLRDADNFKIKARD